MRARVMVGAVAGVIALSACVPELPEVPEAPESQVKGALAQHQYDAVIADTFATLEVADAAMDPDLLDGRIGGLAREVRAAQYRAAEDGDEDLITLPSAMQAVYVSGAETFPRVLAAVSEVPADGRTPIVYLWVQEDARSGYVLQGWARMIPGAAMPSMPGPSTGAVQAHMTESTVAPSPRAAWEMYVDLLREGESSDLNEEFAADMFRERIFSARTTLRDAAKKADGDYLDTIQTRLDDTYVLLTGDGGALVFAPLEMKSAFSVKNARLSVADEDEALLEGTLKDKVTHHYLDFVVMYISGPGVDQRPRVVAADHFLVKVSND